MTCTSGVAGYEPTLEHDTRSRFHILAPSGDPAANPPGAETGQGHGDGNEDRGLGTLEVARAAARLVADHLGRAAGSPGAVECRDCAANLCLSEATIKSHIARILAKLSLRDRVQVAVFAYEKGIVRPGRSA